MNDPWIDPLDESASGVTIQNLTDSAIPEIVRSLANVPATVLAAEGKGDPGAISIVLTSDHHLAQLHKEHLGDPSVTDLMTYPYETQDGSISGDIVISLDRAAEQAIDQTWSLEDEVLFIAIHGMLHLCGWDDRDTEARTAMHKRQLEILRSLRSHD